MIVITVVVMVVIPMLTVLAMLLMTLFPPFFVALSVTFMLFAPHLAAIMFVRTYVLWVVLH